MTATNHALTGAVIGLSINQPLLALPLAITSHFVLDSLPHFASTKMQPGSKLFKKYLFADAIFCAALVAFLAFSQPAYWLLAAACAFLATSPDLMWFREFAAAESNQHIPKRTDWLRKFHAKIQWYQKEPGIVVEIIWVAVMLLTLVKLLRI